jgi:para-nitrobenzyl esterase
MKLRFYALLFLGLFAADAFAQCGQRYKDQIFSDVTVTSDITYSTSNGTTLKLDFYEPTGDVEAQRPLLIMAHGGSFIGGSKTQDNVCTQYCNAFAKRGYVCASIDYRLGNAFQMLDSSSAMQVVMKAISDGKSAVRFFRKDAATSNTYRVNPNLIFVGGNSAGAVLYMHAINIDSLNEAPPHLRTIITQNGGIEGNSGNDGYSSEMQGLVNLAGGLNVPEFVGPNSKPSFNAHGDSDNTVPYNCGNAQGGLTPVRLCGLGAVEPLYQQFGINHVSKVYVAAGHVPWQSDNNMYVEIDTLTANFFYDVICTSGVGIKGVDADKYISVYPNPAKGQFTVTFNGVEQYTSVQLMDIQGRLMQQKMVDNTSIVFQTAEFDNGVYFIRVIKNDGTIAVKKVVLQ